MLTFTVSEFCLFKGKGAEQRLPRAIALIAQMPKLRYYGCEWQLTLWEIFLINCYLLTFSLKCQTHAALGLSRILKMRPNTHYDQVQYKIPIKT